MPGFIIRAVNGNPLRDYIDWLWLTDDETIDLDVEDTSGCVRNIEVSRNLEAYENWGIEFDDIVFDGLKQCKNACTFCFERQLPKDARASLCMRDDDYRLSFLQGTYITLTNLDGPDIERIIEQNISPIRVSLHAIDHDVRRELIGKNADVGLKNLEALLNAGIVFDAQIVLVPGVNDGEVLNETLDWAYKRTGIQNVAVVPLGFTKHQDAFKKSFGDPADAKRVIDQLKPFQERALDDRDDVWVYAADEFYRDALGDRLLDELPPAGFYGSFEMFEDGVGIIRSMIDSFGEAEAIELDSDCADALRASDTSVALICGFAMIPYAQQLIERSELSGLLEFIPVENDYFGGNVNVTGLLSGQDICNGIVDDFIRWQSENEGAISANRIYLIMDIVFGANDVTLDDMSLMDIRSEVSKRTTALNAENVCIAPTNPIDYIQYIIRLSKSF